MPILILPMHRNDVEAVAKIHAQEFPRQHNSTLWISCNFAAYPRIMLFVARNEKDQVVGYIQWCHKSGFRKESVMELEQIAVTKRHQDNGIGAQLIHKSLELIRDYLSDTNSKLKTVMVTTRTDNAAQILYQRTLGAKVAAIIKDLYSQDEVIMIAREL